MHERLGAAMMGDLEQYVERAYREAGSDDPREILYPSAIARRTHGPKCIQRTRSPILLGENGASRGQVYYSIAAWLTGPAYEFTVGHEHAHWMFNADGYRPDNVEECCDYVAAGLMLRRRPFLSVAAPTERAIRQLALDFETTQTMVTLRMGEVLDVPVAVVAKRVRARGPVDWPGEERLRQLARTGAPGLARVKLTDDTQKRVALIVEERDAA